MLGKDIDDKRIDDVSKLVRKSLEIRDLDSKGRPRKGWKLSSNKGRGKRKPKLRTHNVMRIILDKLGNDEHMKINPGHSIAQMLRFLPVSMNWDYKKIITELEESGLITCRKSRPDERAEKYCYRTESGRKFLETLKLLPQ